MQRNGQLLAKKLARKAVPHFSGFFSLGPRSEYNFHSFLRSQSGSDLSACAPDSDPAFFKDLSFRPEYSRSPSHTPRSESIVD